ncbi:MAG: hypothetical protein EHM87_05605 [Burkholderiales bacterium]|nr:MAG: hypothetical protein EHM87_05605 [Burkholderiales bacterium]
MAKRGRTTGAVLAAAVTATWAMTAAGSVAAASPSPGGQIGAAVVGGGRAMSAEELARAGRAIEAAPATTIWQSRLPDGTLELSDRPPPAGAAQVGQRSYTLPKEGAARQRADAEREYWRKQAEGFNRRQQDRDRMEQAESERRARAQPQVVFADAGRPVWYGAPTLRPWPPHGGLPPGVGPSGPYPQPDPRPLPGPIQGSGASSYSSSPGAVQGRATGGFIGSGFATGR